MANKQFNSVDGYSVGNANVVIDSNGNISGNAITATANITAPQIISNVATGTAPLVVSSTTQVANLNAATAGTATSATNAAALLQNTSTATTVYPMFTASSANGNSSAVFNTSIVANLSNASISATTFVGRLVGNVANGTSTISIPATNGNINLSSAGNANILVVTGTGANITGTANVTGNLAAGNISANIANFTTANITGNLAAGNITTGTGTGGNISGANVISANLFTGTLTTAAQPNITSVGTLTSLNASGNANVGNIGATNGVFTNVSGNGSALSSITGGNVTGAVAFATTANSVAGANVSGQVANSLVAGTVYSNAQPNITSVGTLTTLAVTGDISGNNLSTTNTITAGNGLQVSSGTLTVTNGNLDVTGNINVTGNLNYSNVTDLVVGDPLIYIGANNTGDTVDLGMVASYNNGTYQHTGIARNSVTDYWTFFDGVVAEPTTVIDWANATYPTVKLGNLIATANANIGGIANITGNAIVGGTLSVSGNANVGNIGATNAVFTNISGNGSGLTAITGANVTGTVANATYAVSAGSATSATSATTAGTVTTNAQPNITSVGTLTSLAVTGNVTAGNIGAAAGVFTGNANASAFRVTNGAANAVTSVLAYGADNLFQFTTQNGSATNATGNEVSRAGINYSGVGWDSFTQYVRGGSSQSGWQVLWAGNTAIANISNTGVAITGALSVSGTSNLGPVSNVTITGGSNGQVLTTNGSGVLSWSTPSGGGASISNGTSNVNIATSGGNITMGVGGVANVVTVTSSNVQLGTGSGGNISGVNVVTANTFISSVATGVSAAGTTQGTATGLTAQISVVSTVASGAGVRLPTATPGMRFTIMNTSANALLVYPATNGIINSQAANAAYSQPAGARLDYISTTTTQWYTLNATYG